VFFQLLLWVPFAGLAWYGITYLLGVASLNQDMVEINILYPDTWCVSSV
jgi:hypothetical protein